MEQEPPQPRHRRLWPAIVVLLVMVLIGIAIPVYEGKRHQRIAEELKARGCTVLLSPVASARASGPLDEIFYEDPSALPKIVEQTGLSFTVRRIRCVSVIRPNETPASLPLIRQLSELDSLSFNSVGVTASQLEPLLSDVRVKSLYIQGAKLPQTGMPWLNQEGLTHLAVWRTHFSNPAIDDLPESLEWLNAERTRINDNGLNSFLRLKHLRSLNLNRTPCTAEGIENLRKKMPGCKIEWEPLVKP